MLHNLHVSMCVLEHDVDKKRLIILFVISKTKN